MTVSFPDINRDRVAIITDDCNGCMSPKYSYLRYQNLVYQSLNYSFSKIWSTSSQNKQVAKPSYVS